MRVGRIDQTVDRLFGRTSGRACVTFGRATAERTAAVSVGWVGTGIDGRTVGPLRNRTDGRTDGGPLRT